MALASLSTSTSPLDAVLHIGFKFQCNYIGILSDIINFFKEDLLHSPLPAHDPAK